ncbi:MAG: phosphotransferase [Firmicutes bacterium]|nr:phosphotransferase [Bacillota bacterium]
MVEKSNNGTIKVSGRIDASNVSQFEKELFGAVGDNKDNVTIDAADTPYMSSAALRVFLKLKKAVSGEVSVINASSELYDIFDVTGFTSLLNVSKKLREVSVEGCEVIGEGANGKVYRIDDETIIKVFAPNVSMETVKEERDFAQAAFIAGVPTAISYDVVKCGDSYGAVYEMLNAKTVASIIKENPERAEELGKRLGTLLKELHSTQADTKILSDMLEIYKERAEYMRKFCTDEETAKIKSLYDILPERTTLVHGDFHVKNVMLMNDELIFIDMGDVGYGHPLLDLGGSYLGMMRVGKINPAATETYIGINYDLCKTVWKAMTDEYFGENAEKGRKLAEIYGEAKYSVVPCVYTKFNEEALKNFMSGVRARGLLDPNFDVTPAKELLERDIF